MTIDPAPPPLPTLTPYLLIERADQLIDFCVSVFDARLLGKLTRPDGSLMHAEVAIGNGMLMLGEPMGEFDEMTGAIFVRVENCDEAYDRALAAGGTSVMDLMTMSHAGERYGGVEDPFGNTWWIATHVEDLPWEEQQRRIDALVDQGLGQE